MNSMMRLRWKIGTQTALAIWLAGSVGADRGAAAADTGLSIQTYAGVMITGTVGTVFSVEYVTDLAQAEDPRAWRCLEFFQLPVTSYLWIDRSTPVTGRRFYRAREISPAGMVFVPPGTFRMGSAETEPGHEADESPQTEVTMSRGFWFGQHEVTQAEFETLMGNNPSFFTGNPQRPVDSVRWHDAMAFCAALTERELAAERIPTGTAFRLPTEAEWEYASRAWTSTRFSHGDDPDYAALETYAWYAANSGEVTHPVGQKLPNPWGLFDLHGNVWEWCLDAESAYPGGRVLNPAGPAAGTFRVFRGGGWLNEGVGLRSANRGFGDPDIGYWGAGFRVLLAPAGS
jgi:formylglycine-generating enzyme required for sulfatase activity